LKTALKPCCGLQGGQEGGKKEFYEGILSNGRELALLNLLNVNDVDIITETEIPSSGHGDYNVEGYHSFLPLSHSEMLKTAK
jgi:hypothetical protein